MVEIIEAFNMKYCFVEASNVLTPSSHNSFNSLIKGCIYTSILFPGLLGPGMIKERIKFGCFITNHGGKLYGIRKTGQILFTEFIVLNGLKPSVARARRTLRGSVANSGNFSSKSFQANASAGCRNFPSFTRSR
ncbi:hypothetical protein HanIR_Chr03g0115351 [Helianthus annuus]|nr:hypothetical protein HanIR_Chr03g0115351 [Helianthus annuus]